MSKRAKVGLLALSAMPFLFIAGCGGGLWGTLHTIFIHVSDLTQLAAALNLI
jgi:hypothetical protein